LEDGEGKVTTLEAVKAKWLARGSKTHPRKEVKKKYEQGKLEV
jgi:hypothetical protein